jgi:hypothetical protein
MGGRRRTSAWLSSDLRQQLADEAARLMAEHGIQDFSMAKRKAAERLGVRSSESALPSNAQIHERLVERQRIFEPEAHEQLLEKLRVVASDVMGVLDGFRPKLVGPVLEGTVTVNSPIELHVFSDSPEAVAAALEGADSACTLASGVIASAARKRRRSRGTTSWSTTRSYRSWCSRAGTTPLSVEPHRRQTDAARVAFRRARVARARAA